METASGPTCLGGTGGGADGGSLFPSLERAAGSKLGKTVGVQLHSKWAPWFVAQASNLLHQLNF